VRVSFAGGGAGQFSRIADDLLEYPWGCVEQTASRLIPLSLAYQTMGGEAGPIPERIALSLQTNRLRLIQMAGPEAAFGWWGNMTENSALWTAYAYYADWYASRTLRIPLPADHWSHVLDAYKKHADKEPLLHRALALWFAAEMGLPIKTMLEGLQDQVHEVVSAVSMQRRIGTSPLLAEPTLPMGQHLAAVLIGQMAAQQKQELKPYVARQLRLSRVAVRNSGLPLGQALLLMESKSGNESQAEAILSQVRQEMPTFDRALTLVWVQKALLGAVLSGKPQEVKLQGDWGMSTSQMGNAVWQFTGKERKPVSLDLVETPARPVTAIVRYESAAEEKGQLPVSIQRRLYRLETSLKAFDLYAQPVAAGANLSSKELYLEEITLAPRGNETIRYGVLEVALPPGADVERTTWGMEVSGLAGSSEPQSVEKARHEMGQLSYSVPVDLLKGPLVLRHLLRFSQKGRFNLPHARFFRMYQPEQKAFEGDGKTPRMVQVQ
jgi:uncharacterized protein YfaS (alpha-2-macroglobulin family)